MPEDSVEWYHDFVRLGYKPGDDELVALFYVEPEEGFTMEDAAGRVASESSVGTWSTLTTLTPLVKRLMAAAYEIDGNFVKVSYPSELFELGNMPQILSSIAGNVFGMKAVKNLRLIDVSWPRSIVRSFSGPLFGKEGIRSFMKVKARPLTASVPKPKVGLTYEEHAQNGYQAWIGGLDLLKDDENLSSQSFNTFQKRVDTTFKLRDKAEKETGEKKSYLINITAETDEMKKRARLVKDAGGEYVMVDILTTGWAALQTIKRTCEELGLAIHAHRAFHAAFTRNPKHGMSMLVVAETARLIGVDQLHIGTVIGKLESSREEVLTLKEKLTSNLSRENRSPTLPAFRQDWHGLKDVFPVSSGGLHVGILYPLLDMLGTDIIVQMGGGIWGHPDGGRAGAKALRDAIDAYMNGIDIQDYADKSKELKTALKKWGTKSYR
ncbi:MAG: type III ribulose-bisphosphate carboxylase [Conexivisphaerales archaeon]